MQLEYFHLIDRIVDLDIGEKKIVVEAQVPKQNTIFEGHFPGYPLMPGVLLIEAMAQASGWLLLGLLKFERMPILAAVKEAKVRGSVFPGDLITIEAGLSHEGSGFAVTRTVRNSGFMSLQNKYITSCSRNPVSRNVENSARSES